MDKTKLKTDAEFLFQEPCSQHLTNWRADLLGELRIAQQINRSKRLVEDSKTLIAKSALRLENRPDHQLPVLGSLGRLSILEIFGEEAYFNFKEELDD